MALHFPYHRVAVSQPAFTLGGATSRPRPIVNLGILGPTGSVLREAVLDTGADEIVLVEADAALLGIDLSQAPSNTVGGVGSPPFLVRYATVKLRLSDGVEFREWSASVGFTSARMNRVLFGYAGGLEFFDAHFRGQQQVVELVTNSLYPGV
jgi:hypothetical protein